MPAGIRPLIFDGPKLTRGRQVLEEDPFVEAGGPSPILLANDSDKERAKKAKAAQRLLWSRHRNGTILLDPGKPNTAAANIHDQEEEANISMHVTDDESHTTSPEINRQSEEHHRPASSCNASPRSSFSRHMDNLRLAHEMWGSSEGSPSKTSPMKLDTSPTAGGPSSPTDGPTTIYPEFRQLMEYMILDDKTVGWTDPFGPEWEAERTERHESEYRAWKRAWEEKWDELKKHSEPEPEEDMDDFFRGSEGGLDEAYRSSFWY